MASEIILTKLGTRADSIIESFADQTGLAEQDATDDHVVFGVTDAADHEVDVVQTLTEIDADWADHVGFGMRPDDGGRTRGLSKAPPDVLHA